MKQSYKEHLKTNRQARNSFITGIIILLISIAVTAYVIFSNEPFVLGGMIIWLTIAYGASVAFFIHSNITNK